MSDPTAGPEQPLPPSLGAHVVPPDRLAAIRSHMATLSATAVEVGDMLPLEADVTDMIAVLEAEEV